MTPSRLPAETLEAVSLHTAEAAAALGLVEGPIHAELRIDGNRVWMLELAARSIGGLCSRSLRFGMGVSLEELILRHALGLPLDDLGREAAASGVMMLPIPKAGVLKEVRGQAEARAVPGVTGLEISIARGKAVRALPEADRYLGFLFARGETPEQVERTAHRPRPARGRDRRAVGVKRGLSWRCAGPADLHLRAWSSAVAPGLAGGRPGGRRASGSVHRSLRRAA